MRLTIVILSVSICIGCFNATTKKNALEGQKMPSFNILLMDSTSQINTGLIPEGKPIVFYFFSPDCPFCKKQTMEIVDNIEHLKGVYFYFLSFYSFDQIKEYYDKYKLKRFSNIMVGQDYEFFFGTYFKGKSAPYLAIYNENKILKHVFVGVMNVKKIKELTN
jgi:thiol-disulfide isomerase/thioredoxin